MSHEDTAAERLQNYRERADRLLKLAGTRAVEEAARTLALYVGYYQRRHGPIPVNAMLTLSGTPTVDQIADFSEGVRCLAAVFALTNSLHADDESET